MPAYGLTRTSNHSFSTDGVLVLHEVRASTAARAREALTAPDHKTLFGSFRLIGTAYFTTPFVRRPE